MVALPWVMGPGRFDGSVPSAIPSCVVEKIAAERKQRVGEQVRTMCGEGVAGERICSDKFHSGRHLGEDEGNRGIVAGEGGGT